MNKTLVYIKKFLKSLVLLFLLWNGISIFMVIVYSVVPVPITITMLSQRIETKKPLLKKWVSYNDVNGSVPLALVANEDQTYPYHNGFDWKGIEQAYEENQQGRRFRGGSTISQQTAKNVFLWQGKSYFRKALEAYYTFLIELFWSKEHILEVYMNVAETGPGIFGIEAASQYYFNKPSINLTQGQAAQIAGMFPNPRVWNINNQSRKNRIIKQMNNLGSNYLKDI